MNCCFTSQMLCGVVVVLISATKKVDPMGLRKDFNGVYLLFPPLQTRGHEINQSMHIIIIEFNKFN